MSDLTLKLYVAGHSPRTERAITNINRICEQRITIPYTLEIIDVLEKPQLAEQEKILATPTLIRESPLPRRRVVGDLSDAERVLLALDLPTASEEDIH